MVLLVGSPVFIYLLFGNANLWIFFENSSGANTTINAKQTSSDK